jgi:UDP-N-acetylmuramate--alanine ligase
LRAFGVNVFIGHDPSHLDGIDQLIISTAIPSTNKELAAAKALGIPVLTRAEALVELTQGYRTIAVTGAHGKTTTTSMVTVALQACGADPSFAIGSELFSSGANAHQGSGEWWVVEADESDGTFLQLEAQVGIVTNVEADHLDYWQTFDALKQAYRDFAAGLARRGGLFVACQDDVESAALADFARSLGMRVITYGESAEADVVITELKSGLPGWSATLQSGSATCAGVRVSVGVAGRHNLLNAVAALIAVSEQGFDVEKITQAMALFQGTRRRLEYRGRAGGVRVFDDYAHHPTEIQATLRAARDVAGDGRLVVAFQPHHFYRTAMYLREFGEALGLADEVVVLEVFAPGEKPVPGVSGTTLAAGVPLPSEQVVFEPSWTKVPKHLADRARSGDVVMTLGAGDIGLMCDDILIELGASQ